MTVAWPAGWKNRIGGKAPAAYLRGSFSRTTNTAPKNYDCDENDCAPFAPGSPTRPTGRAERGTSERGRACLLRRRVPKRQAPAEALREEVATMRARNTMRFSAPTREPPGGRPSRGAKLKGRGCTRQKDAAVRTLRLGGHGGGQESPERARSHESGWPWSRRRSSGAAPAECNGASVAGQTKEAAVLRKAANRKKRTKLSIFFYWRSFIALRTPRQAQEAATQGTPISPSVFIGLDVRWKIPEAALRLHRVNVVLPL